MKLKIAVVQYEISERSIEENLVRAEEFIKKAAKSKANIIVFPEFFVMPFGWEESETVQDFRSITHFQYLAKKYRIDIVPGSIRESRGKKRYNVAYYIDSNGKIKSEHKKIKTWLPERELITPGNKLSIFNTKYGKIALIICWELAFPELFIHMEKEDAEIVICPALWFDEDAGIGLKLDKDSDKKFVDSVCISRAFENEIIFVFCNAAGKMKYGKKRFTTFGHSQIAIPFYGCVKKLNHNREEMFIQKVDTELLKTAETVYKLRDSAKNRKRIYKNLR